MLRFCLILEVFLIGSLKFIVSIAFEIPHLGDSEQLITTSGPDDNNSDDTGTGTTLKSVTDNAVTPLPSSEDTSDSPDFVFTGCGKSAFSNEFSDRIRGGENAEQRDWPWHVQMNTLWLNALNNSLIMKVADSCGASLINKNWVLTAAHCIHHPLPPLGQPIKEQFYLTFGDRKSVNGTIVRSPKEIFVHPYYEFVISQSKFDMALILLNDSVPFTSKILPICLPEADLDLTGHTVYLTGRGIKIDKDGNMTMDPHLQQVKMEILHNSECLEMMSDDEIGCAHCQWLLKNTDTMVCAGRPDGSVSATHGDSGGPLVLRLYDGTWTQVGVVSTGHTTEYKFGIFATVSKHMWWINKIILAHSPTEKFDDGGLYD